ncbi:MAG: hypothetical protein KBB30_07825 [Bacteroidales bacterium]|jgi:hypothetical protein|nr:hypothetical protein [Bacteroidales bacterium]MDI9552741.1 hypothetical protein [Bacteroidota bacterium]
MDLNATIDIIIRDLNEAREIIDDLKRYPGVPELQVELAKSKCKSAAEVIAMIKNLRLPESVPAEPLPEAVAPPAEQKPKPVETQPEPVTPPAEAQPEPVEPPAEAEAKKETVAEETVKPKEEIKPAAKKTPGPSILADQFAGRTESFNEQLGIRKQGDDVLEILRTKPLSSLNEAIGINDKFLFIREIFDGDTESYNEAIQKLEKVGNLSDAMAIIMACAGDNSGSEAVTQLVDLIKRKFIANE